MLIKNKAFLFFVALSCLNFNLYNLSIAQDTQKTENRYPDYAYEFLGKDKFEKFNRKVFTFNSKLNKYAIKPVHIVWASVMPKYGMDRIQSAYTNIEYPRRLVSSVLQKDFKAAKSETLRFLTNTTMGLGGLYDPAKRYFKIEPVQEDMEQALAKLKIKRGPYLVLPVLSSSSVRGVAGKALDTALDPSVYIASPITAFVKMGLTVNRTYSIQPLSKMIESTYADPYDIAKKLYGIENYIKNANLDRKEVLEAASIDNDKSFIESNSDTVDSVPLVGNEKPWQVRSDNSIVLTGDDSAFLEDLTPKEQELKADMVLADYNPQNPAVDSMRTALFELPGIDDSIWTELSVWNRCFSKQIRTSSINVDPARQNYKYRYIMQKDKSSPIAIIYPSIGEGITSHHSVVLAKLFYDEGYSVILQGSHFHWEFVKSMPQDYRPGVPSQDAEYLQLVTSKILDSLQKKYACEIKEKVVVGTSFGAMTALFLADKEYKHNTMNITKYISINPPIEILFALKQLDKSNEEWNKNPSDIKQRTAITAAKIVQVTQLKNMPNVKIESLPFSEDEGKLIIGFIMRQKLSDLIYTIENTPKSNKAELYSSINNISYQDYAVKYLLKNQYRQFDDLNFDTSLHSIAGFLKNNDNYKIYHTLDDYFVNPKQLRQLKEYSGSKAVLLNNGSHLGFLYREEFINELKKDISLKEKKLAKSGT